MIRKSQLALVILSVTILAGCPTGGSDQDLTPPPPPPINATITPDAFLEYDNTYSVAGESQTGTEAYANAYFAAADPNNRRATLAGFKAINGFDNGVDAHVTFRDTKDLGYGRDMYARRRADGSIAVYVDNYLVEPIAGDATQYGPLNLDAAVARDRQFHATSNALEFSPVDESNPDSDKVVKMFTYGPPDANGEQLRLTFRDMDGRGDKALPKPCFVCHGGTLYPLNDDGSFPDITLRSAKMNLLDPITFEFAEMAEAEQQVGIKVINRMVYDHYIEMGSRPDTDRAKWDNSFGAEISAGPYGDDFSGAIYDESFVPAGWRQNATRPDGVEILFKDVVEPHCVTCHSLRASDVGEKRVDPVSFAGQSVQLANAISFSSYEKFISYNDEIIDRVYRRGRMPASLLNYARFWRNPAGPPSLLATFLSDFDVFDSDGNIAPPGKPVPLPGANRTVSSPVIQDASGSVLSHSFAWSIVSMPANAMASLTKSNSSAATLSGNDGEYVLALTTNNAMASSTERVTLTLDSTLAPAPDQIDFATHVRAVLGSAGTAPGRSCVSCHSPGNEFLGIPVFYADTNPTLYKDVVERVNFGDPENSLLLRKPTSLQHGGGIALNRDIAEEDARFIILLNWIRNGAPCGDDPMFCN